MMNNRFAPVANLEVYKRLWEADIIGDYQLLIATEVVKDLDAWRDFWRSFVHPFIIMDNGLIETGRPTDADTLIRATQAVGASCLVLPDVLGNYQATVKAVVKDLKVYRDIGIPLMGVIQGESVEQVADITKFYVDEVGVQFLSIPRVMVSIFGTRRWMVERARWYGLPIHLLGFSDNMADDIFCAGLPGVMGVDSATPIWLGLKPRCEYFPVHPPIHAGYGSRPDDYWTMVPDDNRMDFDIVQANVRKVRNWIGQSVAAAQLVAQE